MMSRIHLTEEEVYDIFVNLVMNREGKYLKRLRDCIKGEEVRIPTLVRLL